MKHKQALVVGASGLLGVNLLEYLSSMPDWDTVSLSRRTPRDHLAARHVAVDLLDADACARELASLRDVTHVFYLSRAVEGNYTIKVQPNLDMLRNLLEALEHNNDRLQHVQLMQGQKWYGSHLGPYKNPAEESDPHPSTPVYYYGQQDYIVDRQRAKNWTWSAIRPHYICGVTVGSPSNIMSAIGAYATVMRELGLPLYFPGDARNFDISFTFSDVHLLTRAMVWVATNAKAANEAFNVVNGDSFRWRDVWPTIAEHYGMEAGQVRTIRLVDFMRDKEPVWSRAVQRYSLHPNRFSDVADWAFADTVFGLTWDQTASPAKVRRYGFSDTIDTKSMITDILAEYRCRRILP